DNYSEAIQQARAIAQLSAPDEASLETFQVPSPDKEQIRRLYNKRGMTERALLFGVVPIVCRLGTIRFDRAIFTELDSVVSLLEQGSQEPDNDWQQVADLVKLIFTSQKTW